jgi:hypothetical protein
MPEEYTSRCVFFRGYAESPTKTLMSPQVTSSEFYAS